LINRNNLDVLKQQIGLPTTRGIGGGTNQDNVNTVVWKNKTCNTADVVDTDGYRPLVFVKQS